MDNLVEKVMNEFEDYLYCNIPMMLIYVNDEEYEKGIVNRDNIFNKIDAIHDFLLKNKYTLLDADTLKEYLYMRYYLDIHEWNLILNIPIEQRII